MRASRRQFLSAGAAAAALAVAAPRQAFPYFVEPGRERAVAGGPIRLNSNEHPYGCFPSAQEAMLRATARVNRYPDPDIEALREELARAHRVRPKQIVLGSGSNDVLRMAADAFLNRSNVLVTAAPTFEALGHYAARRNGRVLTAPLGADYSHDCGAMLALAKKENADLIYICNPNNPTGSITPAKEIERLITALPEQMWLVIDEAYHHFASGPDYASFAGKTGHPRVVVTRTFSKIYGMAGLRVGYAVGAEGAIAELEKFQAYDTPSCIGAAAALAAIRDGAALEAAVRQVSADRGEFLRQCAERKLRTIPSQANFVMVESGRPVRAVIRHFRQHNIAVGRPFPPFDTWVRISLSTPAEMAQFWKAWDRM